jgi:ABC-type multidrug transport system permease subunit
VANFVLTMPTILIELFFARFVFHVADFGNLLSGFLLIALGTMAFASLGLVVASVTNTMQETQVINQLIWLPLIFLSGATVPLASLPQVVSRVGLFLPATYLVTELQDAIYWSAKPWNGDILIAVGSLLVWAGLTFFLSAQLFRWEPESKIPGRAKLLVAATAIPFLLLGIWENNSSHTISKAKAMAESLNAPARSDAPSSQPH